ncbi:MAG: tetratricopeptide repeat protein [Flavobacteriales bacterium]|nr:tetratricopeptide repeat protein [Flavobacteriales bacterium]
MKGDNQIEEGKKLLQKGEIESALKHFQLAMDANPVNHLAIYYVALSHLKLDKIPMALIEFDRALELSPNNVMYLSDRAVTKLRLKDEQGSMSDLNKCVELDPKYSYRYSLRAFIRNGFGDIEGAIADYKIAIELDPEDPIAINNLGMCEEAQGYKSSAQRRFEQADKLSGLAPKKDEHTIPLKSEKREIKEEKPTYWNTIRSVFTDNNQRSEFLRFTGNLLKGKSKQ